MFDEKCALIVVDMQNDFMQGGALAVPRSLEIVSNVNKLINSFGKVVLTKDWHPKGHVSFASSHKVEPFTQYGVETVWPDHCVQGTAGAQLWPWIYLNNVGLVLHKGMNKDIDSYSAFFDNKGNPTGLQGYLDTFNIRKVFICGLALDYCVRATAQDSSRIGYITKVVQDATVSVQKDYVLKIPNVDFISTEETVKSVT